MPKVIEIDPFDPVLSSIFLVMGLSWNAATVAVGLHGRPALSIFSNALNFCRSEIAAFVRSPWRYCPFRSPEGAPLPFEPPCKRQRPFFVAGDRQGLAHLRDDSRAVPPPIGHYLRGEVVHTWQMFYPESGAYLTEQGRLFEPSRRGEALGRG
jgi:hypothetical protein